MAARPQDTAAFNRGRTHPMRLYFNPRCSKSRAARALLEDAGYTPTIVDYQREPLDRNALKHLIDQLDDTPASLLRGPDDAGTAQRNPTRGDVIENLLATPEQMQRPVLEYRGTAIIARPPERVFELMDPDGNSAS